ncbi:MAG: VWA domain-containing protein [Firmicutes bacterium]|nr:VWA domain-containing protein [Bacillota bacterium]
MLYGLAGFVALLRQAGVKVSPGETADFYQAVLLTGLEKDMLETAALATLSKEERDRRTIEKLLELYFTRPVKDLAEQKKCLPETILADPPRLPGGEFLYRLDMLRSFIRAELERLKQGGVRGGSGGSRAGGGRGGVDVMPEYDISRLVREGKREEMAALSRDAVQKAVAKAGSAAWDFEELLRRVKVSLDWAAVADRLSKESEYDCRALLGLENIRKFETIIIDELDRELWRRRPEAASETAGRANLAEVDFGRLDLQQIEDIKRMVLKMARYLAARVSYRRAASKKGEVDLRRTVRRAAQTGGVPLVLRRRAKMPHSPELAVLCDLSGSVSLFTGFMLQLIYAVQDRFRWVRTFAFVDDVEEITDFLKGREPGQAIIQVIRNARIARTPFSDYGAVWKEFCLKYLEWITPKTTVLILGDARSNWKPPGVEYLELIRERAARIIWLNPAPRELWDREDSVISLYSPLCHRLFECRNLKQLGDVARYIGRV